MDDASDNSNGQCYAVIFSNVLSTNDEDYAATAARMEQLATQIPGFLGVESVRQGQNGITISYWESEAAIRNWRAHPEHLDAQARGKSKWYAHYTLRVAKVLRRADFKR